MTFEVILKAVKCGVHAKRTSWTKKHIALSRADDFWTSYIYITNSTGEMMPWTPTQSDLFANDWELIPLV